MRGLSGAGAINPPSANWEGGGLIAGDELTELRCNFGKTVIVDLTLTFGTTLLYINEGLNKVMMMSVFQIPLITIRQWSLIIKCAMHPTRHSLRPQTTYRSQLHVIV